MAKLRLESEIRSREAEREMEKAHKLSEARRKQNKKLYAPPVPSQPTKTEEFISIVVQVVKALAPKKWSVFTIIYCKFTLTACFGPYYLR